MKKRLPWIGTVLVSVFLLFFEFVKWLNGFGNRSYLIFLGICGILYGIYRVIYPDKND